MTVAKLVRLYQDETNEAAAEKQAFELRRILKEAVLAMMNVLPIFTGTVEDSGSLRNLDLSTAAVGSEANAPSSPSVNSPSRFDPSRRLSLPSSPKRAPFSPAAAGAASSPAISIPRADKDFLYQELCRDGDRKRSPPGCDIAALETYLSDAEFERVLKMTRPQFYVLPPWRQRQLKVAVKLW